MILNAGASKKDAPAFFLPCGRVAVADFDLPVGKEHLKPLLNAG